MSDSILQPGGSMEERLRNAAKVWRDSGRSQSLLLTDKAFFLAQCWLYSSGTYQRESGEFDQEIFMRTSYVSRVRQSAIASTTTHNR